jgi:hypothetical protein
MPLCIDDISASHTRPVSGLPTYLLLEAIRASVSPDEPAPSDETIRSAENLIAEVPSHLIGEPDVGPFCGEIHLSWTSGVKQVVLMFFPSRAPLIHYYEKTQGAASRHNIEDASADRVAHWLRWLRE